MSPTALPDLAALVAVARAARANAYAPYSRYAVGSAVLTDDGRTFSGVNVENASYGATVCADESPYGPRSRPGHGASWPSPS